MPHVQIQWGGRHGKPPEQQKKTENRGTRTHQAVLIEDGQRQTRKHTVSFHDVCRRRNYAEAACCVEISKNGRPKLRR